MALTQVPIELSSTPGIVDNSNATAITIDSSENVLVGTTDAAPGVGNTDTGGAFGSNGYGVFSRTGTAAQATAYFNKNTNDGTIIALNKDGTAVGGIGVESGDNFIIEATATDHAGLLLWGSGGSGRVTPRLNGSEANGTVDLGRSAGRFKDLYLSGGAYLGGTGSANKLDDYEEGTWTPTIGAGTISFNYTRYIKVGNKVTVSGFINTFSDRTSSSAVAFGGLPFVSNSQAVAVGATLSRYINAGTGGDPVIYTAVGNTVLHPYVMTKAGNYGNVLHSDLHNSSANIYFSITYEV